MRGAAAAAVIGATLLAGCADVGERTVVERTVIERLPAEPPGAGAGQIRDEWPMKAVGGERGSGVATVMEDRGKLSLLVEATGLRRTRQGTAYEVWLYNGRDDALSLGAQLTDPKGRYQGAGRLPGNYRRYRYVDVSREVVDANAAHSGRSVLRARVRRVR